MLFQDTWPLLQEGKCLSIHGNTWFIFLLPTIPDIWVMSSYIATPAKYNPTIQDLLANNWEVVQ
jgi:hypothetical protein